MKSERLDQILSRFGRSRIAVLGDFFLDKYYDVDPKLAETSVETGKVANQIVAVRCSPGSAGTVVNNLAALKPGKLYALGFIGADGEGFELTRGLEAISCDTRHLVRTPKRMTPLYLKPRDMNDPSLAGEHERYDIKNRTRTPRDIEDQVIASLDKVLPKVDAVIISDQVEADNCGVVTDRVRAAIQERAKINQKIFFFADSRAHIHLFRDVMIKPNQFEAINKPFPKPDEKVSEEQLREALPILRKKTRAPVVVTRGALGMLVSDPELTFIRGVKLGGPLDPTGAGDSALAGCTLALASGATLPEAALLGILVSSITVQQLATTGTATQAQVRERLKMWIKQGE
ncbi:MAG TPA: PfkB family carbohydrate kinase [Planctomycetota bacterium]|jgi:bifunctional ADP-heptose synthase (sugar kinase/adenylyltransferase)